MVNRISWGRLTVVGPDGFHASFGPGGAEARIELVDWDSCSEILTGGDNAFAEGYMQRRWHTPDLVACYRTALNLAADDNLHSIAFPAISTGVYSFPADLAARIAVGTVVSEISAAARGINRVVFCCFSNESADHHINAFRELGLA